MRVPYVIDSVAHRLGDILNGVLAEHHGRALDVATAYFTVGGFSLLRQGLESLGSFRMILGAEPTPGEQIGLRPDAGIIKGLIERDLEQVEQESEVRSQNEEHLVRTFCSVFCALRSSLTAWVFLADPAAAEGPPILMVGGSAAPAMFRMRSYA